MGKQLPFGVLVWAKLTNLKGWVIRNGLELHECLSFGAGTHFVGTFFESPDGFLSPGPQKISELLPEALGRLRVDPPRIPCSGGEVRITAEGLDGPVAEVRGRCSQGNHIYNIYIYIYTKHIMHTCNIYIYI